MKKKLKVYSVMLAVVLMGWVFWQHFHVSFIKTMSWEGEPQLSFQELPKEFIAKQWSEGREKHTEYKRTLSITVPVVHTGDQVLIYEKDGKKYRVDMERATISLLADEAKGDPLFWFFLILAGSGLLVELWFVFFFLKFVFKAIRGEVFVAQVAHDLALTGKVLIGLAVLSSILAYVVHRYMDIHSISLGQYAISLYNSDFVWDVIIALALMVLSQIILMGKELQEEQELTI